MMERWKPVQEVHMSVFFKTAGGKRQLLPELRKYIPESHGRYFEPFVGGGALFFDLASSGRVDSAWAVGGKRGAYLNDANPHMMAAYVSVQDNCTRLITSLRGYESLYKERGEKFYYEARSEQVDPDKHTLRAAARFLFLNRTAFNGLYRVNLKGEFNVPHGKYKNPTICDAPTLRAASDALTGVKLTCQDFEQAVKSARRGDLVYFDPPYWPKNATSDFTAYTKEGFGPAEQVRLRDVALALKRRGVHVILSNADVTPVRQLYSKDFELHRVQARRAINSKTDGRGSTGELIIT